MRVRRAWLPAMAVVVLVAGGWAATSLLAPQTETTMTSVRLDHRTRPFEAAVASCPGGVGSLQLTAVAAPDPPAGDAVRTTVMGRSYAAGPSDGPARWWVVSPVPGHAPPWPLSWSSVLYRLPGLEPVALRGENTLYHTASDRLVSMHYGVDLFPEDVGDDRPYLLVVTGDGACGAAAFTA